MLVQPKLLQKLGLTGVEQLMGGAKEEQLENVNPTDVCVELGVEPGVDVAVHALVIPDVPPAPSHPWS
jgi:hypothetical protein